MLIDLTRLVGRALDGHIATGVDRVAMAYLGYYQGRVRGILRKGSQWVVLSTLLTRQLHQILSSPIPISKVTLRYLIAKAILFNIPERLSKSTKYTILLNIDHNGLDNAAAYKNIIRRAKLRPVYLLHDLIPISHPEYCRQGEKSRHDQRVATMLDTAWAIITNSHDTLSLLNILSSKTHPNIKIPPAIASLLGTPELFSVTPTTPALCQQPYFVLLSTIEPRKNHWLILHVWKALADKLGEKTPRLLLIGRRGWECENIVDLLERSSTIQKFVTELPNCRDEELANYLHFAQALLFPSFVEGYGLPVAEALQAGVPVIASDLAVFREFAEDIPEYLSPIDGIAWFNAILDYTDNHHPRRQAQLKKLTTFSAPSWDDHFRRVDNFLDNLIVTSST